MNIKRKTFNHHIFHSRIPVAVVFSLQVQGLGIARSLNKEGIPVLGIDYNKRNYGLSSKYVTSIISPNAAEQENSFIDFMINLGKRLKSKGVLFPTHDNDVLVLSRHRKVLEEYFLYPMAEYEVLERCVNKLKLYPAAEKIGIPIPRTFSPNSMEEAKDIAERIDFPYIIKPDNHEKFYQTYQKTALLGNTKKELVGLYKDAVEKGLKVMIQEMIQGRANRLYTLGSYADKNSHLLGIFTGKKIRQFPAHFGTCRVAEPVSEPKIVELGERLIKGLKYHGISQVEFKKDPKDEKFKLMEINARNWMWISLPTACGVNLPAIAYKDTIGEKISDPIDQKKIPIKWTWLDSDFRNCCLGGYKKTGHPEEALHFFRWLQSVKGKKEYAIFSWKDPLPFFLSYIFKVQKALYKFLKRKQP